MNRTPRHLKPRLVRLPIALAAATMFLSLLPHSALADQGMTPTPANLWSDWTFEPAVVLGLIVTAAAYSIGLLALWRHASRGHGTRARQAVAFAGGWIALGVALVSPLDALTSVLFSAHMLQHLLMMLVAAPLFALSAPLSTTLFALPESARRAAGRAWGSTGFLHKLGARMTEPVVTWLLFAAFLWVWHVPALYQAAVENDGVHILEHICLFGSALLFWLPLANPKGPKHAAYGAGILCVFTTALHTGALGAILTFTAQPWYEVYAAHAAAWGLTPLDDQQLAGLIMWIPGSFIYVLTAAMSFIAWLNAVEQDVRENEILFAENKSIPARVTRGQRGRACLAECPSLSVRTPLTPGASSMRIPWIKLAAIGIALIAMLALAACGGQGQIPTQAVPGTYLYFYRHHEAEGMFGTIVVSA